METRGEESESGHEEVTKSGGNTPLATAVAMPVGVGDCCATKLLAFAAAHNHVALLRYHQHHHNHHGSPPPPPPPPPPPSPPPSLSSSVSRSAVLLRPVAIAEVFFGSRKQTQRPRAPKRLPLASPLSPFGERGRVPRTMPPLATTTTTATTISTGGSAEEMERVKRVNPGTLYDACEERCRPVLGFMLCGLE